MQARLSYFALRSMVLGALSLCIGGAPLVAQQPTPPDAPKPNIPVSRVDLYGGYAYIDPYNSGTGGSARYQPINPGAIAGASYFFNRYLGAQVEGGFHPDGPNDCMYTGQVGPVLRLPIARVTPFIHVLGGASKVGGPMFQPCTWGWGVTGGGGLDYLLPVLHDHLAWRIFQADYERMHVDFGTPDQFNLTGGTADINSLRLATGVVLKFGNIVPPPPVALSCSVTPTEVYVGDPVTLTADATNLNPKMQPTYTWTSTSGKVAGSGATATIDTKGVAAGTYSVAGHITEGPKPGQSADCKAEFTVKNYPAPTIECSANPTTVNAGESSTITAKGASTANRQLTYSYSASAGNVSGSGTTATLSTAGVSPGPITVTCNVVDDKGQTATTTTSVTVSAPPPPPAPEAQKLCSVAFDRDKKRPTRVDNEAKACLDDIALSLQRQSDAKLVVVGESGPEEKNGANAAAERALNVRQYLTKEKGIDAARIDVRTSGATGKQVEDYLLPPGATFNQQATEPVDASKVHSQGQPYGTSKKSTKKK